MKLYLSLISTLFLATLLQAETKPITFEKTFGSKEDDVAKSVIATEGGFLVVGKTRSFRDRREDVYVFRIDEAGNKLWSKAIGGDDDDEAEAVVETDDGYVVVGTTRSFGGDRSSIYTLKLDKKGASLWQRALFSSDDSYYYGTAVAKTANGYKVVGWENKLEFFDAEVYGYVVDLDKEGERLRRKRYGGEDDDMLYDVLKTDDGYLLVGASESMREDHGLDGYVVKIDKRGKVLWQKVYGWGYDESFYAIAPAPKGDGYLLVGITKSNRDKRDEVYVVRIGEFGKVLWQNTYGGRYDESGFDVVSDEDGFVIVGFTETKTHGREDVYVFKIDDKGRILWEKKYGGRDSDVGYGIAKAKDGYLIVGETESYGNGRKDAYLLKIDKKGEIH